MISGTPVRPAFDDSGALPDGGEVMKSARELLDELNAADEHIRIEAKRSSEIGKSVMETVCAYANEPGLGGGYLLLG